MSVVTTNESCAFFSSWDKALSNQDIASIANGSHVLDRSLSGKSPSGDWQSQRASLERNGPTEDVPPDDFPWQKVSVSLQSVADSGEPFAAESPCAVPRAGKPVFCPVCYREFKMRRHMVVHMRSAHNVNPTTILHMPYLRDRQVLQKGHAKRKTSAVQKRHKPKAAGAPAGTVSKASTPKAKQKPQPGDAAQQPPSSSRFTGGIGRAFPCKRCGRSFDSLRGLLKHEQVHQRKRAAAKGPLFKCSKCGSLHKYLGGLVRHRLTCAKGAATRQPPREKAAAKGGEGGNGTKTFGCNKCGAVFDNQVSLARHKGWHKRKPRAASGSRAPCQCNLPSCKVCGRHQKAGGSVAADHSAAYTCHLCLQPFRTKEKLSTHLITKHFSLSV
ncbi:flt3-interacting zinc finger protein 1-like isoform X2 [Dermacentor albipictus]|uniref:flt3-interacting zinc finger protein 1-like isoform X2 n=1 Tax=Dermacentor albipictus TaxID=60249 RepID=UPI0038FCADD3